MFYKNKNIKVRAGFTLIELLVVISIIGLLASVVFVSLNNARAKARWAKMLADFRQFNTAMELYYDKYNYYPCDVPPSQDPGSGPVPVEENIYCVSHGLVASGFISKLPTPPCPGWEYDWENWSQLVSLQTGNAQSQIVRLTLRDRNNWGNTKYYFCYKDTHGSTEYACGGRMGDAFHTFGGIMVNSLVAQNTAGSLFCD